MHSVAFKRMAVKLEMALGDSVNPVHQFSRRLDMKRKIAFVAWLS